MRRRSGSASCAMTNVEDLNLFLAFEDAIDHTIDVRPAPIKNVAAS